jgi:hypothetical protein
MKLIKKLSDETPNEAMKQSAAAAREWNTKKVSTKTACPRRSRQAASPFIVCALARSQKSQHDRYPLELPREISGASSMARFA